MTDKVFGDPNNPNLIGLWDFLTGAEKKDSATAVDGQQQDGMLKGHDSGTNKGQLVLDDDNKDSFFKVVGDYGGAKESAFDLNEATVQVRFEQSDHNGGSPDVLVSRGEYDDRTSEGFFSIAVTKDGGIELHHQMANGVGPTANLKINNGFFDEGDDVEVFYSFDSGESCFKGDKPHGWH